MMLSTTSLKKQIPSSSVHMKQNLFKKPLVWVLSLVLFTAIATFSYARYQEVRTHNPYDLKNGDIVFQETNSHQGRAVKAATDSRWTHVGLVFFKQGKPMVIEGVQPVSVIPLSQFIARSPKSFYAMRLKERDQHITAESISKAEVYCNAQLGKDYDFKFRWSDDRIYCSELVWKAYKKSTGIELCSPRAFKDYKLDHPTVKRIIKRRYGSVANLPLDELVVAPSDLAQSKLLMEVPKKQK